MDPGQHTSTSPSLGFEGHFNFFLSTGKIQILQSGDSAVESAAETPAIFLKVLLELSANRRNKSRAAAGGVRF